MNSPSNGRWKRWRGPLAAVVAIAMGVGTAGYAWAGQPAAVPMATASASPSAATTADASNAAATASSSSSEASNGVTSQGAADASPSTTASTSAAASDAAVSDNAAAPAGNAPADNTSAKDDSSATTPSAPADASSTSSPSADSDSANAAANDPAPAAVADAAADSCDAVTTWATLKSCLETANPGTVTMAGMIVPDEGTTINVKGTVVLDAKDGAGVDGTGITRKGSVFSIEDGDDLTIRGGIFRNLSSSGVNGVVVHTQKTGNLTIAGGSYANNVGRNGTVVFQDGTGTVTITGGEFSGNKATATGDDKGGGVVYAKSNVIVVGGNFTGNTADGNGGVFRVESGTLAISGGSFENNSTSGSGGVVHASKGTTITFEAATFEKNTGVTGGVIYMNGVLNVLSGLFKGNGATGGNDDKGGGAIRNSGGVLTVSGGTFTDNTAAGVGGAVSMMGGETTIEGGTFNSDVANDAKSKGNHAPKGGAVAAQGGTLKITGGMFDRNQATASVDNSGGGAIYAKSSAVKIMGGLVTHPVFSNNMQSPEGCSVSAVNKCMQGSSGGGAIYAINGALTIQGDVTFDHNGAQSAGWNSGGGAVWAENTLTIKNDSTGAPSFIGNWATISDPASQNGKILRGGAGGAVFLNATDGHRTTAYMTGGVYSDNTSGYLGGAVYTEEYSTTYVGKAVAYGNVAGHFGGGLWFCPSGSSTASKGGNIALFDNQVTTGIDANNDNASSGNTAETTSAGADFAIMNPGYKYDNYHKAETNQFQLMDTWFTNRNNKAVDWQWDGVPLRYSSGYHDSWMPGGKSPTAVLADFKTGAQAPGMLNLSATKKDGYILTGVALKATNVSEADKQAAKEKAQLTLTGNRARLSGGAYASNGVVVFDSPYSMSWEKKDGKTEEHVKTPSTWSLTAEELTDSKADGPYMDEDMRPTDCQVDVPGDDCWHKNNDDKWTVAIVDNGVRDNDPDIGVISLDNLAPGTYTLRETGAPTGYQATTNVYQFVITAVTGGSIPKEPDLTYQKDSNDSEIGHKDELGPLSDSRVIGNKLLEGYLAWTKTDDKNKTVGGSEWMLYKPKGATNGTRLIITDCDAKTEAECANSLDKDNGAGNFKIDIHSLDDFPDGHYWLQELKSPDGYWMPDQDKTIHDVTIGTDTNKRTITWGDGESGQIINKPTTVSWSKVDSASKEKISGAEWTVMRIKDADGNSVENQIEWTVLDCGANRDGCTKDEKNHRWADSDSVPGGFKLETLTPGTYTLTETKAPDGYAIINKTYTFTIGVTDPVADVKITGADKGNLIANARVVAVLPHTGGLGTARAWLTLGGLFVVAGGVAWAALGARRRRAAMAVSSVASSASRSRGRGRHAA
ncbi:SpaA isopeptide-forming pilin-related protein [Bifidobacterium avesanii]|nr:SpaA isopeptide-forming pilin-related protein [Bifidobacterium avesanii]